MKTLGDKYFKSDPFRLFALWYREARKNSQILQPDAMCVSTLSPDGYPAGRMLLLKSHGPEGFVFYTNFKSLKGRSLLAYPKAAYTFYWEPMGRQVRLIGEVAAVSEAEADAYFQSRPRLSQIGAWASQQSAVLKNRAELDRRFSEYRKKFQGREVPRPSHWSGFRLLPREIEFWQARPNRLHDRIRFLRRGSSWKGSRLNP